MNAFAIPFSGAHFGGTQRALRRQIYRCKPFLQRARAASCRMASNPAVVDPQDDPLIQYVVVRRDLLSEPHNWPTGSVISQGIHAAVAAVSHFEAQAYLAQTHGVTFYDSTATNTVVQSTAPSPVPHVQMRTVTLEAKDEVDLLKAAERLKAADIAFALWTEMPESMPTAIATRPMPKSMIFPVVKRLRLFR
ncbi:putative peptidyl-tRNA hydrolase PTRHD1 [Porphyridium purpureum]|uniref:peptidyl-tRNA hydrolase n=1 Tax=Porphyridium purpureum TaxID=35688 RepID=A0A5J4YVW9_PORPP|nr:putative peptidyl-tRNA hydrolase PTRHD1 [Porphyridium purpureum]|eukprot:POR0677..scf209_3